MEYSEKIWHLFAKGLNREISPGEQAELNDLLREDPSLARQYELLTRVWVEQGQPLPDNTVTSGIIAKIISKASNGYREPETEPEPGMRVRRLGRYLLPAAAVLILAAGLWFYNALGNQKVAGVSNNVLPEPLVTKKGSRSRYLLPDGTVVWLNAGSVLSLENDFTGATREVRLVGEGYFNVVHNTAQPFIVHTSGVNIKVLGTVFNVKAYAEDKNIETTLLSGSVKVFREKEDEKLAIRLERNQKLVMERQATGSRMDEEERREQAAVAYSIEPVDSSRAAEDRFETAWLYSRLVFRGDDFETLAQKMERWYNINIEFSDEEVKSLHFNGSFEKETAEQAMMALQAALPKFKYSMKNQYVTIASAR
ncbi:MAG: DUF4974 domain-containing protein [Chitinophagaceae bacterium]|nr:MAG: DUF4974 domain-containing protein [Chitinophagaceae bacterium]